MLSFALIGCFTVPLISKKETQEGKYIFKYFLSQLYRQVIILYIKCGHQEAVINTQGIETAFERSVDHVIVSLSRDAMHKLCLRNSSYHTFHKIRCLSVMLRICKSFAIILISPYSVYVVSVVLCTVTDYS